MYARTRPIRPVALNNDGSSFAKALGWTDVCTSGTGPVNIFIGFDWDIWQNLDKYYAVSLTASTEYTFSGTDTYSQARFTIYDQAGTKVAENSGQWLEEEPWYIMPSLVWTPTTTGVYVVRVGNGAEMPDNEATYATSISPRPATHTREGFTPYGSSTGFDGLGRMIRYRSAVNAGLALPPLSAPNDLTANDSNPEWVVDESSTINNAGEGAWKAFNGSTGSTVNRWMTAGDGTGWIRWRSVGKRRLVRSYKVYATNEIGWEGRSPNNWTLEGSDDGETWTVIHTVTDGFGGSPSPFQEASFTVPAGNTSYYYHRMNITANYSGSYLSIGQIKAWSR